MLRIKKVIIKNFKIIIIIKSGIAIFSFGYNKNNLNKNKNIW